MNEQLIPIDITVNGQPRQLQVAAHETLLEVLREKLDLKGTKQGCDNGQCGACTVLLNGRPVNACLTLAVRADGRSIQTIEGVSDGQQLHPLQEAFIAEHAVQCGYCTPGMIMSAKALLDRDPQPPPGKIREALSGNICRCTGYTKIVKAVERAANMPAVDDGLTRAGEGSHERP